MLRILFQAGLVVLSLGMKGFDYDMDDLPGKIAQVKSNAGSLSFLRLLIFVGIGIFGVLTLSQSVLWALPLVAAIIIFIISIQKYNYKKDQEAIYNALILIDRQAGQRKDRELVGIDQGKEFQDKNHPFANDLDLFGEHSLFQLVNHTVSKGARKKLADLMKSSFDQKEAKKLQKASEELAGKPGLLKAIESCGIAFFSEEKSSSHWRELLTREKKIPFYISVLSILGPVFGLILVGLSIAGVIPGAIVGVWILLGLIPLGYVFKFLKEASEKLPTRSQLKAYTTWLFELEKMEFSSALLKEKHQLILTKRESASQLFKQLDRLGMWIDNRLNILYIPFNLLLWTDLMLMKQFQTWINTHGEDMAKIPNLLEDWEVLISLGAFEHEIGVHGDLQFEDSAVLEGLEVSHPLLKPEKAIANDFQLGQSQRFILLTGANMSGKTTFMRTLGINAVMANLGLKPFASKFKMGDFQLYTSMRNTDNLGESVSSFYAELSRIHNLIERLEKNEKIFFLLDEILKGTNTEDRIAGSEALLKQVAKTEGLGIVSTHDIELSALEGKIAGVENRSFHSEILDDTINFDYKLKRGPCPSFNAHKLMELMGIRFQE
ncbi:DNA mismatch repair protein [Algoriphagus lutimaris]|uniref:MutS-related protein n=1 Tax=Algoriphagus lutimaris TaxID=613197 RepID=UPI00196B16FE|nr:DNA mismatch repair protein [Algoriphagus lutimaris]MBN3521413.1 DNA mismatch repair protein [Algoriphagus lutimaris]